ncbi:glycosyltransferase family 2 protein [Deinococcus petrolearius]|uniref:Glycosyltransferase family 2 protein n=1 Tax=Deinococcus petrolearius TaxID=1751295 RepID=A0ABW1DEY0_9DEIO
MTLIGKEYEVEIIMPVYNGAKYLSQQLDSLLLQNTDINWRVIISDDGSTDESLEILELYKLKDRRVSIAYDERSRRGVIGKFNWLLSLTTAPYVMFCDQDDVWDADKISVTLLAMVAAEKDDSNSPVLVHTDLRVVDKNLSIISKSFIKLRGIDAQPSFPRLLVENPVTGCSMMINRNLISLATPLPADIYMHDWWFALVAESCGSSKFILRPTISYRQHSNNSVGVKRVGFTERLIRLKSLWSDDGAQKMYDVSYKQAELLIENVSPYMSYYSKEICEKFLKTQNLSKFNKRFRICQGNFLQKNLLRRILLLMRLK